MKTLILAALTVISTSSYANQLICNHGNGSYKLTYSLDDLSTIRFAELNAQGLENVSTELTCTGPMEAAYSCTGEIATLSANGTFTGPKAPVEAVLGENQLGAGGGLVEIDGTVLQCSN